MPHGRPGFRRRAVRTRLAAGGRWIRTIGPCREGAGLYCGDELGGSTGAAKKILRGTDGSNPSPSSGESLVRTLGFHAAVGFNLTTPVDGLIRIVGPLASSPNDR